MWPSEHDRNRILLVEVHHLSRSMIRSSILEDDGVLSPVLVFLVKHLEEVTVEHLHHRAI